MDIKTASLCAELSKVVYTWDLWDFYLEDHFNVYQKKNISISNAECGIFYQNKKLYIVVRGTEFDDLDDILTDLNCIPKHFPELEGYKVHSGFLNMARDIWKEIQHLFHFGMNYTIFGPVEEIICTGHSLGGAVSTLLAVYIQYWCETGVEVYSFGSPKVLTEEAEDALNKNSVFDINHHRFVNNNDIVANLPLNEFVWEHCGDLYYINRKGKIFTEKQYNFWRRVWDKILGRFLGFGDLKPDGFNDHQIVNYSKKIKQSSNLKSQVDKKR